MEELWKSIEGYELYEISTFGRVKGFNGKIRKPHIKPTGHLQLNLRRDNIPANFRVHRLVAEAFIPNPNNYPAVRHKDGDPANNRVDNLEWGTIKMNSVDYHSDRKGTFNYLQDRIKQLEARVEELEAKLHIR